MATVRPARQNNTPSSRGEEPRERILAAAGREFAERGYESATVRDICLAAGVNVAAINYYFGDKRRLYIESVKHAHDERVKQVPLPEWPAGRPAAERLHDFVDNLLERMLGFGQPPWQVRLMLREVLQPTDACRELVEDYMRPHFALLVSILDDVCDGRLLECELRRVAISIIGQCFLYRAAGDVVRMLVPADEIESLHTPKKLADHVTRYALAALGAAEPLARPGHRAHPTSELTP
ncbi:MAG: TetR/AcrR family transcriptional regulator [Planctomycetia bacterium]